MILLIVKENYQLSLLRVDFGWINNNIKFSLKLMQIEITSTLPSVGWMWISICTRFNSNLILLFIHPYPPSKGSVYSYICLYINNIYKIEQYNKKRQLINNFVNKSLRKSRHLVDHIVLLGSINLFSADKFKHDGVHLKLEGLQMYQEIVINAIKYALEKSQWICSLIFLAGISIQLN